MTKDQITLATHLARCIFPPGTATKRFAKDIAFRAGLFEPKPLTEKQAEYLRTAVIRFRRQIPCDVVALARSLEPVSG
jgi:hypothetical protein